MNTKKMINKLQNQYYYKQISHITLDELNSFSNENNLTTNDMGNLIDSIEILLK